MKNILRIGVCDDEKVVHDMMIKIVETYAQEKALDIYITNYMSGQALIDSQDIAKLDALFLDIEMPELDGVETAYRFNEIKHSCKIIMLTSKVERFKEAFKIGAFRFVTKPIAQNEVFEVIDDVRARMLGETSMKVHRDGREHAVIEKDIAYITLNKTSTYVYTEKYDFRSDESLEWWENELDNRLFVRCHKGYIVNVSKIVDINKKNVVLVTGECVPVARRRVNEVEQRLMEYDTKYR